MSKEQFIYDRVRPMTRNDVDLVLEWRNHPDIRKYMYTQYEISPSEHQSWFERESKNSARQLLIFEIENKPMGFVNFNIKDKIYLADWGFYTSPEAPEGTGLRLARCALDYAFKSLNLHKVCGEAIDFNQRSIEFHLKLGFQKEGVLREQYYNGESYKDVISFGILSHEWLNK